MDEKNIKFSSSNNLLARDTNSGLSTQRFVQLSVELEKMTEEMKNLASQTENTKSGVRFLARETAANMERAERIIMAIRTQLHWARSAVVALAIGVLLMVFNQRKMYMSAVAMSGGFGEASAGSTFKFGVLSIIVSRTLEVTAIVALFAAIVSLFLQDGGEMLSNMFMDSSDLEKSNEETSLKMTGLDDNVAKGGRYRGKDSAISPSSWQIQAFSSARRASFPSVTLVDDYRRNCAEAASSRNSARARRCELCQKTMLRHRRVKMTSSLGKKIKMETLVYVYLL